MHCDSAAIQYYGVLEIWKELEITILLYSDSEAENRYDEHEVVVVDKGKKMDYLPKSPNQTISKISHAGHDAHALSLYAQKPYMYKKSAYG
ncbi:MAG: hypothetical protein P8H45_01825 [Flavobacteriaceae bacterium]|nr:hypothetical protein [Flavobacteriaceae bacterium]